MKVSNLQRGNSILKYLSKSIWHYDEKITCDYEINGSIAVLFLSLKYHSVKPEYILKRISKLKDYRMKLLLIHVDVPNYNSMICELYKIQPLTVILCRNQEECAEYLKGFESTSVKSIEQVRNKESNIETFLQDIPKVTKSEINRIRMKYKNLQEIIKASEDDLKGTFGIGKAKANSVVNIFNKSFKE